MSKEDFLQELRAALAGEVPQTIIQENIQYYDNYITGEVKAGTSETQIIDDIGAPRLIAKTIIDAELCAEESGSRRTAYTDTDQSSGTYGGTARDGAASDRGYGSGMSGRNKGFHFYDLSKWYGKLIGIMTVLLMLSVIVTVIGGLFSLLAPLILPFCVIMAVMWIFRGGRR